MGPNGYKYSLRGYQPPLNAAGADFDSPPQQRRILVIDDIREYDGAVHAKTVAQGILMLQTQQWDEVWLDHDLGGMDTIRPVVHWMVIRKPKIDKVWAITANPDGAKWIRMMLRDDYDVYESFGGRNMSLKMLVSV